MLFIVKFVSIDLLNLYHISDTDMVTLTIVVIMVILLANEVLMLMPMLMLMLTITVILLTVWDPFTVMVTTHMPPVTMVTTWASVALMKNLDLILNLMPMVTIPGNILFQT